MITMEKLDPEFEILRFIIDYYKENKSKTSLLRNASNRHG